MKTIAKALTALLTALGTWGVTALADDAITGPEWFGLCGVAVAGLAVWAVPNHARLARGNVAWTATSGGGGGGSHGFTASGGGGGTLTDRGQSTLLGACIVLTAVLVVLIALGELPR